MFEPLNRTESLLGPDSFIVILKDFGFMMARRDLREIEMNEENFKKIVFVSCFAGLHTFILNFSFFFLFLHVSFHMIVLLLVLLSKFRRVWWIESCDLVGWLMGLFFFHPFICIDFLSNIADCSELDSLLLQIYLAKCDLTHRN